MANDPLMSQDEIERLLGQAKGVAAPAAAPASASPASAETAEKQLGQAGIEKLLEEAAAPVPRATPREAAPATVPPPVASPANPLPGEGSINARDIEYLLNQAEQALESVNSVSADSLPPGINPFQFEELSGNNAAAEGASIALVRDVELDLKIELGRTQMYLEDVLKLRKGAVVPLDKLAGDPVDIYVNGRLIARGEVLVLNDNFCVRVAELLAGANMAN
jgi:flagellar motor switch protein FliN